MMNIFDYLDYYVKNNNTTFGGINNKEDSIKQMLNNDEYEIYEQIKNSDRQRLIKFS